MIFISMFIVYCPFSKQMVDYDCKFSYFCSKIYEYGENE